MIDEVREAVPKEGVLTVKQDEAQALYEFVTFIGRHAFDTFRDDLAGFRGKSVDMRRHLDKMRDLLWNLMDYPTLSEQFIWGAPQPMSTDEANSLLLTEVGNRNVRYFQNEIFWRDSKAHFARLEFAIDDDAGETCGLLRAENLRGQAIDCGPGWSASGADFDETIRIFVEAFPMQQFEAMNEDCINEMLAERVA